jgi:DNA-binding response OmpR family regulator
MRVLVAEDEMLLAKQLVDGLRRAGYAVDHAADGERADLLGHDERYDAVVLDLGLPKVDGLTLLRRGGAVDAGAGADGAGELARKGAGDRWRGG